MNTEMAISWFYLKVYYFNPVKKTDEVDTISTVMTLYLYASMYETLTI